MKFFSRRGLARNERGSTAVEFAMLLPLFLAFILGIIDICAYFFVAGQLQYGVEQASRAIRVGSDPTYLRDKVTTVSVIGKTATQSSGFRILVCDNISTFMISSCTTNLMADVRSFSAFDIIAYPVNPDANANGMIDPTEVQYCAGEPSTAVVARVFYNYTTIVPGLRALFAAVVPGTVTIQSTTTFRTEPYNSTGVSCP